MLFIKIGFVCFYYMATKRVDTLVLLYLHYLLTSQLLIVLNSKYICLNDINLIFVVIPFITVIFI